MARTQRPRSQYLFLISYLANSEVFMELSTVCVLVDGSRAPYKYVTRLSSKLNEMFHQFMFGVIEASYHTGRLFSTLLAGMTIDLACCKHTFSPFTIRPPSNLQSMHALCR